MITIDQLTRRYRNITAVDGLNFEVGPGGVTGFLGPNGAGKATALRMLLGLARRRDRHHKRGSHPGHRGRRPRRLHGRVADRRLAGRAAPGRDLTHPPDPAVVPRIERRRWQHPPSPP
jgi:ABC-2 type transport system ATP-binding protein